MFKKKNIEEDEEYGIEEWDHHNPDINVSYTFNF